MNESRTDRHTTAVALNNRGVELLQRDSLAAARSAFEEALKADARYPGGHAEPGPDAAAAGRCQRRRGPSTRARSARFPADPMVASQARFQLGEIDMASGAYPSAIAHYSSARWRWTPTDVSYFNNLGFALDRGRTSQRRHAGAARCAEPVSRQRAPAQEPGTGAAAGRAQSAMRSSSSAPRWAGTASLAALRGGLRAEAKAQSHDFAGARADWDVYLGMQHDETERAEIEPRLRALGALGAVLGH